MYATMHQYAGVTPAAFDALMGRRADVETLIRQTPGFLQYDLVRTTDGMTSVTVCADQAGTEASNQQVAAWIATNLPALGLTAPTITAGEAVVHFAAK
jgi:hypothetical protein